MTLPLFTNKTIILASNSPRRKQLLKELGVEFQCRVMPVEEKYPESLPPEEVAQYLSQLKVRPFLAEIAANTLVITADTVVVAEGRVLGKPQGNEEARQMLEKISGASHSVYTGVTITTHVEQVSFTEETRVWFRNLNAREIQTYIEHFQPFDKAGAYGIQEWIGMIGIEKIEGCYYNVMGLPVGQLYQQLKKLCVE
ncbi:Maf family nucleotide pyrophosphatase [Rapidithrix thailandica]|uniref:dTTP/UTP pyrophosphatase n=1 Tax=Rapidithrix thailandica TaxID=413964 RepID=A0AAW9SEH7_9BACT